MTVSIKKDNNTIDAINTGIKSTKQIERINYLDFAKGIAIFLVIETHAREMAGTNFYGFILKAAFYSIDRNGVLLFFLCSGAMLLSKSSINYSKLLFKSLRVFFLLSFYSIITNLVYYTVDGKDFIKELMDALIYNNMLTSFNYDKAIHLWFLCSYLPLLIISPLVGIIVRKSSDKVLSYFILILLFCGPLVKVLITLGVQGLSMLDAGENATFLLYMIIGYSIHNNRIKTDHIDKKYLMIAILLTCTISVIVQFKMFETSFINEDSWRVLNNYASSIFLLPSSICIYILIRNMNPKPSFVDSIGRNTFGVYLTHYSIMICVFSAMPDVESLTGRYFSAMIASFITLPLSLLASGLIKRVGLSYLVK